MNKTNKTVVRLCNKHKYRFDFKRLGPALPCDVIILKMKQNILFEMNIIKV